MGKKVIATISLALGVFFLSGCGTGSLTETSSPKPLPSDSPSSEENVDLTKSFREIAKTSCDRAYEEGVTERIQGQTDRLVLLPASYLYNDFFAAVVNDDGGVEPIWSTEMFSVCIDHINFLMAEESDSKYEIFVSGDLAKGVLQSEYKASENGIIVMDYVIKDGVFAEVRTNSPETEYVTLINYGTPSEADIESFREAIDLFLASE
jgi:hypothetical protein